MDGYDATLRAGAAPAADLDEVLDGSVREPELRLMLAVLEDAIVRFRNGIDSNCPRRSRQLAEVGSWIRNRDLDSPFSFENVCHQLHLDPDSIRSGLEALRRGEVDVSARLPRWRVRRGGGDDHRPNRQNPCGNAALQT